MKKLSKKYAEALKKVDKNKEYSIDEAINLVANWLVNFANVTIPLALINVLNGFQGAFAFILGFIGVKFLPKYFNESLSKKIVIQKVSCIILSIIGLIIMFI